MAILHALSGSPVSDLTLSDADDTRVLVQALRTSDSTLYAGEAGTVMRFLLAYRVAMRQPCTILCAPAMEQRPIRPLVDALSELGASVVYLGKDGFPPVQIKEMHLANKQKTIKLDASKSSQFLSALLMIGPVLPGGLKISCTGSIASEPYVRMTLACMENMGVRVDQHNNSYTIEEQTYTPAIDTIIEADWSSAAYWYGMIALMPMGCTLTLHGLKQASIQGDSTVAALFAPLGVHTLYTTGGIELHKINSTAETLSYDFADCPDLVQPVVLTCAALGTAIHAVGLHTLPHKETHRIRALAETLKRLQVEVDTDEHTFLRAYGKAKWEASAAWEVYGDHRMAMSLAILAVLRPVTVLQPEVVQKSYPEFWSQMVRAGFGLSPSDASGSASGSTKK